MSNGGSGCASTGEGMVKLKANVDKIAAMIVLMEVTSFLLA